MKVLLHPQVMFWAVVLLTQAWLFRDASWHRAPLGWLAFAALTVWASSRLISVGTQTALRRRCHLPPADAALLWLLYILISAAAGGIGLLQQWVIGIGMFGFARAAVERAAGAGWGSALAKGAAGFLRAFLHSPWLTLVTGIMAALPGLRSFAWVLAAGIVMDEQWARQERESGSSAALGGMPELARRAAAV